MALHFHGVLVEIDEKAINEVLDEIWKKYDTDNKRVLDKAKEKLFVKDILEEDKNDKRKKRW